jgi:hypothetical protein
MCVVMQSWSTSASRKSTAVVMGPGLRRGGNGICRFSFQTAESIPAAPEDRLSEAK